MENKLITILVSILAFALPLFFLPLTQDFYQFNKIIILYIFVGSMLAVWALKIFTAKKLAFAQSRFNSPLIAISLVFVLSTLLRSSNKLDSFNIAAGQIIALCFLAFIMINFLTKKTQATVLAGLLLGMLLLSWQSIFSFLGWLNFGPEWLKLKTWSLSGSPIITGQLLLITLPLTLFWAFQTKKIGKKISLFCIALFEVISLGLLATLLVKKVVVINLLPFGIGWQITVEGMKNLGTALFGTGPGNYLVTFNRFKPVSINTTPFWMHKFTASSNQFLTIWSTVGLLGLLAYLWLFWAGLQRWPSTLVGKAAFIGLIVSLIIQLLMPVSLVILFVTFLLAGLITSPKNEKKVENSKLVFSLAFLGLLLCFIVIYQSFNLWRSEYFFFQSLASAKGNQGVKTYELQVKAVQLDPVSENIHLALSQTNFALANSLAGTKNLTDKEKASLNQLLLQSVSEAKITVNLNPQQADYWLNLATIYRNLTSVSTDAKDWAQAAYLQAIKYDPVDPTIRLALGGLLYNAQLYDQAIQLFNQSVELKPDYTNGYYNLAAAYRAQKDWPKALTSMETVLSLVQEGSSDYLKASQELEEIKQKLPLPSASPEPETVNKPQENLTQPEPIPSTKPGFKSISLPGGISP